MKARKKLIFLFLDGVGIGRKNAAINPFFAFPQPALASLLGGHVPHLRNGHISTRSASVHPLNATLRVPGLPQSGTGQAAILTGINAPKLLGKHFGPYPYSTLRPIIEEHNFFRRLAARGLAPYYSNAFPNRYFEYVTQRPARMGAIASAWLKSGFALNTAETLKARRAVSADLTADRWHLLGHQGIDPITAEQAGQRLVNLAEEYDLVFFEYYFTDKAGHDQKFEEAGQVLDNVNRLIGGVTDAMNRHSTLLLLTSDHGNLEDLSTKSHTRNPVPLLGVGAGHERLGRCRSLLDIAPFVLDYFD